MTTSVNSIKINHQMSSRCLKMFRQDMNCGNHSLYERTYAVNTGGLSRGHSQVRLFLGDRNHVQNAK